MTTNNQFLEKLSSNPADFSLKVALGLVPGFSTSAVIMRNPSASNSGFFDIWGGGGDMILPTSAETWTIESDDAEDTATTGSGAWTVLTQSLAEGHVTQSPQVTALNGTTPVDIMGTHYRTHQLAATSGALVLTAGATRSNKGTLTVRDKTTGDIRMRVLPTVSKSEDGHIAVPAGLTLIVLAILNPWGRDQSGKLADFITPGGVDAATIQSGIFPAYQNDLTVFFQAKFVIPEKTDKIFKAKPDNDLAEVTVVQESYLIDNETWGL